MKLKTGFKLWCLPALVIICASVTETHATEVFTWKGQDGVVHYSDMPPENVDSRLIRVDGVYKAGTTVPEPATQADGNDAGTDTRSVAQQRREKIAEDREARREAREEAERLCARHQQRLEQMEPARRVFYTDDTGESVRMDDDQRMALISESKEFIAKNCR
ncbi:MAG: DUF4124 domain-containing protein [Xanthomonadales bacterium]|jgi:hypothetical protein|nr:DUF4124 domain-containing protein [Xanthomonadales bacterium]MDH3923552.1 DUF4124 domain-containing protein [Xanthomonadales bacterium]MDH4001685.1 DUF4124 domain-containing protein [Xanthomonadales bacterium]